MNLYTFAIYDQFKNLVGHLSISAPDAEEAHNHIDNCLHYLSSAKLLK